MAEEKKMERRRFACMGNRLQGDENSLSVVLVELDAGGRPKNGTGRYYALKKTTRIFHCGAVYSLEADDTSIRPSTYRWEGRYEGPERAQWEADERIDQSRLEMLRRNKKAGEDSDLLDALLPWRKIYFNTIGRDRRVALELIVRPCGLRRGSRDFRTRYQRCAAACDLLRDLELRTTNAVIKEYCGLAVTLLAAPPHERAAVDARVVELLAAAVRRKGGDRLTRGG
jgi:hypothetical protein